MSLFTWKPDSPYYFAGLLMIFCFIIAISDKRLNKKVEYEEGIGHSGPTG
jgi:hypothetical protein